MKVSEQDWTGAELAEFDRLTAEACSRNQMERINARLDMKKFVAQHGKEKCNAMYAHILAEEAKGKSA